MTCLRIHARLDDFQRHLALHRLGLLGHEHHAHAPFADLLQQFVRPDDAAGAFGDGPIGWLKLAGRAGGACFQECPHLLVMPQQRFDFGPQAGVAAALGGQVVLPLLALRQYKRIEKDGFRGIRLDIHAGNFRTGTAL